LRENKKTRVIAGMSGGVDSAVAALLLQREGYDVTGVFMKNWDEKNEEGDCTAAEDSEDAALVCQQIGIPYYTVNFEKEYYDRVFTYFLEEYARGRTPNPDVLCNSEIKFKAFLDFALRLDADYIATGHYARAEHTANGTVLKKGLDAGKDQTYFLSMLDNDQLSRALFPIGELQKSEVREIAREAGFKVSDKKDSTGICFIGERRFKQFLQSFLPAKPGDIVTVDGETIGRHDGLMYYTLGQRKGLGIGGCGTGERWFVVEKDMPENRLVVAQGSTHEKLFSRALLTAEFHFISGQAPADAFACKAKFRYRQGDQEVFVTMCRGRARMEFAQKQRAVTPGQFAVLYEDDVCLGGGVIDEVYP
jgi:tRNA-specific 2-thiouridylase